MAKLKIGKIYLATNPANKKDYHYIYLGKSKRHKGRRLFYNMEDEIATDVGKNFITQYDLREAENG